MTLAKAVAVAEPTAWLTEAAAEVALAVEPHTALTAAATADALDAAAPLTAAAADFEMGVPEKSGGEGEGLAHND